VERESPETVATVRCVECGREAEPGELWRLLFADEREVAIYCPSCAEREFGED
jgi:DNA-directed RNA polymerase subunit RPC12/RpoP